MTGDRLAEQKARLWSALRSAPDRLHYSYTALLRQEIATLEQDGELLRPGVIYLLTSEAFGSKQDTAVKVAASLTLLGAMSRVFEDIAAEGPDGLEREWGTPRTLNALDAFYVLAQSLFLEATSDLDAERQIRGLSLLDEACHQLSLDMHQVRDVFQPLFVAGAALAGLIGGGDDQLIAQLRAFARNPSAGKLESFPATVRGALTDALPYITSRS